MPPERLDRRTSGIHEGETVVERQGDYRIREPSRTPRRRWSVYSITTTHWQGLSILHMQNSEARLEP
jgi:PhoPQ-activated pathogenicity-related protein